MTKTARVIGKFVTPRTVNGKNEPLHGEIKFRAVEEFAANGSFFWGAKIAARLQDGEIVEDWQASGITTSEPGITLTISPEAKDGKATYEVYPNLRDSAGTPVPLPSRMITVQAEQTLDLTAIYAPHPSNNTFVPAPAAKADRLRITPNGDGTATLSIETE